MLFLNRLFEFIAVFERHHIDRNFERTGQTTIIVAPGSGMFEVDREMTSITKQRLLDSGKLRNQVHCFILLSTHIYKGVRF